MAACQARSASKELTNCKQTARIEVNRIKCRHCLLLYAGACPLPAAKSAHVMQIHCGSCSHAVVHPAFRKLYPEEWESRRHSVKSIGADRSAGTIDGEGPGKCNRRRRAM